MNESEFYPSKMENIHQNLGKEPMTELEIDLRKEISDGRKSEMDRYGRTAAYDHVSRLLLGDRQTTFSLINHALAVIDDGIDVNGNKTQLSKAKVILKQGFQGEDVELAEKWEKNILKLGQTLSKLRESDFAHAEDILNEVINFWEVEAQNLDRRGTVLAAKDLDDLNLGIGKSISMQFLYLLCPGLDKGIRDSIASSYGLAIKLADNLSDLSEDLKEGFINISRENIALYGFDISDMNRNNLQAYRNTELARIKRYYAEGDEIVSKIIKDDPAQRESILTFKDIAYSWLKQAEEMCFIGELKQFDIAIHPAPEFIAKETIQKMEGDYHIRLSDVISLSYSQEARNVHLVRQKDPFFNPYSHEKTFQANEAVKRLISKYPEIKDVLDLGCDDGARTTQLFAGKILHGIEQVADAAEEARKRGVVVYQGSMISDVYKDPTHLSGREFDLVSIMGEMVNFVGLDTDMLLANAIRQTRDTGYVLISCMHSKFDASGEGSFVVWSSTETTKDRWELGEAKIPRTFQLISKQGFIKRMEHVSSSQNCHLIPCDEESIDNYYGDMRLGVYIFLKKFN